MCVEFSDVQRKAMADPKCFEIACGDLAYEAWKLADAHYRPMCLWRRSDLDALTMDNWPLFVDAACAAFPKLADDAALWVSANTWYSAGQIEEMQATSYDQRRDGEGR